MPFGKYNTQEFHHRGHNGAWQAKWEYWKDGNNGWYDFYNALHKNPPASEKILNLIYHWNNGDGEQLWEYIKLYNRLSFFNK